MLQKGLELIAAKRTKTRSSVAAASPTPRWDAEARIRLEVCGIMSLEWNAFSNVSGARGIRHEFQKWNEPGFVSCMLDGAHRAAC